MTGRSVTIVRACLRDGEGGSPTAVLPEVPMSDVERRRVPVLAGTSHAVFVSSQDGISLRFFTAEGELGLPTPGLLRRPFHPPVACGHGTVGALAFHAGRAEYPATIRTSGRVFAASATPAGTHVDACFDPGPVELREPTAAELDLVLPALGVPACDARVASVGRPRLLVPVPTRSALAALAPDLDRLRAACDRFGFLGCYAYTPPTSTGRAAARMFAPSIGVPEDVANANSTACLAAHLAGRGRTDIAVDMGDSLARPSTITATARRGPSGPVIRLGGAARVTGRLRLR